MSLQFLGVEGYCKFEINLLINNDWFTSYSSARVKDSGSAQTYGDPCNNSGKVDTN